MLFFESESNYISIFLISSLCNHVFRYHFDDQLLLCSPTTRRFYTLIGSRASAKLTIIVGRRVVM